MPLLTRQSATQGKCQDFSNYDYLKKILYSFRHKDVSATLNNNRYLLLTIGTGYAPGV